MSGKGKVFLVLGIVFLVIFLIWGGIRIFSNIGNPTVAQGTVFLRAKPWEERERTTQQIAREITPRVVREDNYGGLH